MANGFAGPQDVSSTFLQFFIEGQKLKALKEQQKEAKANQEAAEATLVEMLNEQVRNEEQVNNAALMAFVTQAANARSPSLQPQAPFLLEQAQAIPQQKAQLAESAARTEATKAQTEATRERTITERQTREARVKRAKEEAELAQLQRKFAEADLEVREKLAPRINKIIQQDPQFANLAAKFAAAPEAAKAELQQEISRLRLTIGPESPNAQLEILKRQFLMRLIDIAVSREETARQSFEQLETMLALQFQDDPEGFAEKRQEILGAMDQEDIGDRIADLVNELGPVFGVTLADLPGLVTPVTGGDSRQPTETATVAPEDAAVLDELLQRNNGDVNATLKFLKQRGATDVELKAARNYYRSKTRG